MLAPRWLTHQAELDKHKRKPPAVPASGQFDSTPARASFGLRRWLRGSLILCAWSYPAILLALWLGFYWVGEAWWVTAAGLYVPRLPFLVPVPFVALALYAWGLRRLLWTQVLAAFIVTVPLMGFILPWPMRAQRAAPTLRVLSFNVNSAIGGAQALIDKIVAASADIVLLQEAPGGTQLVDALRVHYPYVQSSTQFIIASRFPITAAIDPDRLFYCGRTRPPRFMRYELKTPIGPLALYNIHPISPRGVLHIRQLRAALHQLRTGELFAGDPEADVESNVGLRALQVEAVTNDAARESLPVLIAGDTNLPGLSALLRKRLSGYTDAFRAASWGFGYTFPEQHPFLRLDRILASDKLRFSSFRTDCHGVSDHLCVVADLQARQ
jgi:vancomycin resistance protein VanJ